MPTAFEQRQQAAMNQGFVPSAAPMVNDNPVIGQVTSAEATPGPFVPGGGPPGTMTTTDVTLYGFYQEFADLEQSEQESYAEAMFTAGLGDGLGLDSIEDIYQPWAIQSMLNKAIDQSKRALAIGRTDYLPTFDQRFAGQEETSLENALARFEEKKPKTRFIDRTTLEGTAQSYFQDELGRSATASELKSFVAGIHAAQAQGQAGQEIGIAGRAREFALEADPERAAGMDYSKAAGRAMKALGMN